MVLAARAAGWIRPLGRITAACVNFGAAVGRRDSRAAPRAVWGGAAGRGRRLDRSGRWTGARSVSRSARRAAAAVAFEHRLASRAQREARVAPAAMQVPFKTRDRRQVHRGPRVPVAAADAKPGSHPAAWSAASSAASRPMPDGIWRRAMPDQGPAHGPGSPTRRWQP